MADKENTGYAMFEDDIESNKLSRDEILMSEADLLSGLLELENEKNETRNYKKIQIKRDGVVKLEFRIRPISEDESQACYSQATKYAARKPGQPKREIETDRSKFRSLIIYTATVNEDRTKVWDNPEAVKQFGILQGWQMVERVLKAGEKDRVMNEIDEISGYNEDLEEAARD